MRDVHDFGNALVVAGLSILLTLGALSVSLVGFIPEEVPEPTQVLIVSPAPVTATHTPLPSLTPLAAQNTPTSTPTHTVIPPTSCQVPAGWIPVSVQYGETLDAIAFKYNTSKDALKNGNCLFSETLLSGTLIYVPRVAATSTVVVCIQGASGWVKGHVVKSGDTFFNIGARYGVNANTIKAVNCRSSDFIYPGETLWVPNVPTRTPTSTPLPGVTFTIAPILTEPFTETVLPFTLTPIPTQTPIPATSTTAPTATPILTQTASPTAFPTSTTSP
jgi:LysM repeat protein